MRKYLVLLWLLLPLPVVVLHFGRGQQWLARDKAHTLVKQAQQAEQLKDWKQADILYRDAAKCIATDSPDLKLRLDLAQIRTRFQMGEAVAAIDMADKLLEDPATAGMPKEFHRESRDLAARIHYYAGWVMRLEGASRELWMEEAELARQNFRLLAESSAKEEAKDAGKSAKKVEQTGIDPITRHQENLESAVQLQRLSLTELMARPLPKEGQAMSGQGLTEQMAKRRGQRGKGNKTGQGEGEDGPPQKGAGTNRFQPGTGS